MVEYKMPVLLNDDITNGNVQLIMNPYVPTDHQKYKYMPANQVTFTIYNVIMGVTMKYDMDEGSYMLDADLKEIENYYGRKRNSTNQWFKKKRGHKILLMMGAG